MVGTYQSRACIVCPLVHSSDRSQAINKNHPSRHLHSDRHLKAFQRSLNSYVKRKVGREFCLTATMEYWKNLSTTADTLIVDNSIIGDMTDPISHLFTLLSKHIDWEQYTNARAPPPVHHPVPVESHAEGHIDETHEVDAPSYDGCAIDGDHNQCGIRDYDSSDFDDELLDDYIDCFDEDVQGRSESYWPYASEMEMDNISSFGIQQARGASLAHWRNHQSFVSSSPSFVRSSGTLSRRQLQPPSLVKIRNFFPDRSRLSANRREQLHSRSRKRAADGPPDLGINGVELPSGTLYLAGLRGHLMRLMGNPVRNDYTCVWFPRLRRSPDEAT